jgi:hypothetical protein
MATPSPWDEYRRRRNLAWFAFLGYVPVCFTVAVLSIRVFSTFTPAFVVAIAWMIFFVIAGNLAQRFPCPRCGKWFFAKWCVTTAWHGGAFTAAYASGQTLRQDQANELNDLLTNA